VTELLSSLEKLSDDDVKATRFPRPLSDGSLDESAPTGPGAAALSEPRLTSCVCAAPESLRSRTKTSSLPLASPLTTLLAAEV
jgi:hypothetical protein